MHISWSSITWEGWGEWGSFNPVGAHVLHSNTTHPCLLIEALIRHVHTLFIFLFLQCPRIGIALKTENKDTVTIIYVTTWNSRCLDHPVHLCTFIKLFTLRIYIMQIAHYSNCSMHRVISAFIK